MARKAPAPAITADNYADAAGALNLYCRHYHAGQWTVLYRIGCETDAYSPGDRENPTPSERPFYRALERNSLNPAEMLARIKGALIPSGYCDCACRDCFEIAITGGGIALCHGCADANCDIARECECSRADAYAAE